MLSRLARTSYRHRRLVLAAWLGLMLFMVTVGGSLAGTWATDGRLPGTDSQRARDIAAREFPQQSGDAGQLVFANFADHRPAVDAYIDQIAHVPGVAEVDPLRVAPGGTVAVAPFTFATGSNTSVNATATRVEDLARPLRAQGIDVEFGGSRFQTGKMPASEAVGLLAAVVILLVAFGSVVAMGLPIITALVGIATAIAGVGIIANVVSTPEFAPQVATMIGLGVGIDYALLIVTRYREALGRAGDPQAAVVEAMTTAGRSVVFAGCTVVISLLGMLLMGLSFLNGLALGCALAVGLAVLAAVTLLPALLGFVGHTIDRLRIGRRRRLYGSTWARWAEFVQRRPGRIAVLGFGVLLVLAIPVASMRLGTADAGNDPPASTTRKAYDLVADGFGPGTNGPVFAVAELQGSSAPLQPLVDALRGTPGVVSVSDPVVTDSGRAAMVTITPSTGPQDPKTAALLRHLRHDVVPAATAGSGAKVFLGSQTAADIDFAAVFAARLPVFIGAVLVLSFLLLLVVFRSILVPLKAVVMNLLSIAAAYGVMVATFQWGWLGNVLHVSPAPIEPWAPMMLFAIVFGLSMDYEVFLLSSVREHYDRTGDNRTAVAAGLAGTARVITAAALIMVCVFASFVFSELRPLKLIGLGLSVAVAIDATLVRVMLVPATMELLGRANWWLPRWLDRLLPRVNVEGEQAGAPAETELAPAA
jgi:RND superfamily putative drug exporter